MKYVMHEGGGLLGGLRVVPNVHFLNVSKSNSKLVLLNTFFMMWNEEQKSGTKMQRALVYMLCCLFFIVSM